MRISGYRTGGALLRYLRSPQNSPMLSHRGPARTSWLARSTHVGEIDVPAFLVYNGPGYIVPFHFNYAGDNLRGG